MNTTLHSHIQKFISTKINDKLDEHASKKNSNKGANAKGGANADASKTLYQKYKHVLHLYRMHAKKMLNTHIMTHLYP